MHIRITSNRRLASLGLLLPVALLLSGCGVSAGQPQAADPGATSSANASVSSSASASKDDGTASFGKTYTWNDGLAVTVTDQGTFTPSTYAAKSKAKSYRKFQITVKNGTKELFSPALFSTSLQDGEQDASNVTDIENKIGIAPTTKLLPGRTVKWIVAYGVDTDQLVMQVTPDLEHDAVLFQGK